MGMISKSKKIVKENRLLMEEDVNFHEIYKNRQEYVDEKYITRSYFKEDKEVDQLLGKQKSDNEKKPAEVFRTDFITAMKIPDSQQLPSGQTIILTDTWKQEWEKGVQVPVGETPLKPIVRHLPSSTTKDFFILPVERITFDEEKYLKAIDRSSTSCSYDLDDMDVNWLDSVKKLRTLKKVSEIDELTMERAITYFERKCFDNMVHAVATKEGLSIEYDESTTCMVCLSPDAEDDNEIIFCDACNMCVHQHCYGVLEIPEGNWLCNPCSRGVLSPPCYLCPNSGGAMKRLKDSYEWVHVMCAWWIPEVKIEDSKYVERITIDKIPIKRWNLSCEICHVKKGACIQCTVKRCVRAYHITCAAKEGLELKTVIVPEKDDVHHISFCSKHCTPIPPEQNVHRKNCDGIENTRLKELRKLESNFHSLVKVTRASKDLNLDKEATRRLHSYWTLRRRDNGNVPLIKLTFEQQEKLSGKQGVVFINQQKTLEMERFLFLRQDLERLRNLCYMIVRREKIRKEIQRVSMDIFYKENDIALNENTDGNSQNILRCKPAKFNNFSDIYCTNKVFQEETGLLIDMCNDDEILEEYNKLENFSSIERFNPNDLSREEFQKKLKKKKNIEAAEKSSDRERNIFSLFNSCIKTDHKLLLENKERTLDILETRKTVLHLLNENQPLKLKNSTEQIDDEKNVFDKIDKLIESNDSLDVSCDEISIKNDCCKKSILAKRGKKRFRNLHDIREKRISQISKTRSKMRFFYPNYSCLPEESDNPPNSNNTSTLRFKSTTNKLEHPVTNIKPKKSRSLTNNITSSLNTKHSIYIDKAKRRRLNVSSVKDEFDDSCDSNPTDFIRITRSRVAS
ncbi:protein Jade-1 isoform X2 [Hydra vulgaris]|uniref:Protein Jade-1 isoform X2 n=1 Tax=Hydra vulgaris TaxID=6087 RepID=A0ABM4D8J1_HYDVU